MINTVEAGLNQLRRYKEFHFGIKPEKRQFYQLGEGYLEAFFSLYRSTTDTHYLQCAFDKVVSVSPLKISAQQLKENALRGEAALEKGRLAEVLTAVGEQFYLAASHISFYPAGLYSAPTRYSKAQSFGAYRQFVEKSDCVSLKIETWFKEARRLSTLLLEDEVVLPNNASLGQQFTDYQRDHRLMNQLYVMINMGFYLLEFVAIDIPLFLSRFHQSHLSQRWLMSTEEKLHYFNSQCWDATQFLFLETHMEGQLCYHLESEQLVFPPDYIQPDLRHALFALSQCFHRDQRSYPNSDFDD